MNEQPFKKEFKDIEYRHEFAVDGEVCLSFPVENGKVIITNPYAQQNYDAAISNPKYQDCGIRKIVHEWTETWLKCRCGQDIQLFDQYLGASECPHCGQWHNLFGQELLPPDQWGDLGDDEWDY